MMSRGSAPGSGNDQNGGESAKEAQDPAGERSDGGEDTVPGAPREVENRYEALVTAAPDAIVVYNFDTNRIVEANPAAAELFGRPPEAFEGLLGEDLLPEDVDLDAFRARFRRALDEAPTTVSTDGTGDRLYVSTAEGRRVPVDISVAELELDGHRLAQAVIRDLSDRRRMAADLERAEHHLGSVVDNLPAILLAVDTSGAILHVEGSGLDRVGLSAATLRGEDIFTVFRDFDDVTDAVERALAGESFETDIEFGGVPFRVWLRPVRAPDGSVDRAVGLAFDLTDERRRHQLLQVLNRVLRHNLRNDLNVVLGGTAMLRSALSTEPGTDPEATAATWDETTALDRITEATERLLRMSEKARAIGDVEAQLDDDGPHGLDEVVRSARQTVRHRFPQAEIDCQLPDTQARVAAVGFEDAVAELVDNAVRHNDDDHPRVAVTVRLHERPGREIELTVADDGPGLSGMEREVLRAGHESPLRHSGGLGLWLVNWVVMTAGGSLDIQDTDSGTTIVVRLPRSDAV